MITSFFTGFVSFFPDELYSLKSEQLWLFHLSKMWFFWILSENGIDLNSNLFETNEKCCQQQRTKSTSAYAYSNEHNRIIYTQHPKKFQVSNSTMDRTVLSDDYSSSCSSCSSSEDDDSYTPTTRQSKSTKDRCLKCICRSSLFCRCSTKKKFQSKKRKRNKEFDSAYVPTHKVTVRSVSPNTDDSSQQRRRSARRYSSRQCQM